MVTVYCENCMNHKKHVCPASTKQHIPLKHWYASTEPIPTAAKNTDFTQKYPKTQNTELVNDRAVF
jgi:hypothetical protein